MAMLNFIHKRFTETVFNRNASLLLRCVSEHINTPGAVFPNQCVNFHSKERTSSYSNTETGKKSCYLAALVW